MHKRRFAREKKDDLRQEILDVARDLFVTEGFTTVSMRKIAQQIGYSATTLYLYFKNKAEIVHCLEDEFYERILRRVLSIRKENLQPLQRLRKIMRSHINLGLRYPNQFRIAFLFDSSISHPGQAILEEGTLARKLYDHYVEFVAACVPPQENGSLDVNLVAQSAWACIHGLIALLIIHPNFPWVKKEILKERVIESAIHGIVYS